MANFNKQCLLASNKYNFEKYSVFLKFRFEFIIQIITKINNQNDTEGL